MARPACCCSKEQSHPRQLGWDTPFTPRNPGSRPHAGREPGRRVCCLAALAVAAVAANAGAAIATAGSCAMVAAGADSGVQPRSDGGHRHRRQREGDQAEYELQFRFHCLVLRIPGWAETLIRSPNRAAMRHAALRLVGPVLDPEVGFFLVDRLGVEGCRLEAR